MIMSFLTFCLSCSQLFAKGRFTGLSSVWRPLTCHSYGVGVSQSIRLTFIKPPSKEKVTKLRPTLLTVNGQWIMMILIKSPSKKLTIKFMTISLIMMM